MEVVDYKIARFFTIQTLLNDHFLIMYKKSVDQKTCCYTVSIIKLFPPALLKFPKISHIGARGDRYWSACGN